MPYKIVEPVIDYTVRSLCIRPYPNHPKGCPNYQKRTSCPPHCNIIKDVLKLNHIIVVVWNVFDFASHCQRMREKHPHWSERQVECCLYWQQGARKQLENEIDTFLNTKIFLHPRIIRTPEARGVNVTETMKSIGEILEWPPKTKTYQVALVGTKI